MTGKTLSMCLFISLLCFSHPLASGSRELLASVGNIVPHSVLDENGVPQGGFVEIVRAIDRVYTEGTISIRVYPIERSMAKLKNGDADFQIPYISNPKVPERNLDYTFVSEPITDVVFVLYTRSESTLSPEDDLEKRDIETLRGAENHFSFKISGVDSFRQGLLRASLGRSDGFIAEQDACDLYIRDHKIENLRRTFFAKWKSSIAILKGPRGREIDDILSTAMRKLKQSGELQKITSAIHLPYYEDWQPFLTDWESR